MYGRQLGASLEEVAEMIAILKAIQKQQRELQLLSQRARIICPNLVAEVNSDIYRFINYAIPASYSYDSTPGTLIEQLTVRKNELQEKED